MAITPEQLAKSGSEHSHQVALFQWAALNIKDYPQLKWLFAVPNGFYSSPGQKAKMKAEGLKDGVPDVWLPIPVQTSWGHSFAGLAIELKVGKNKTSKDQDEWIEHLDKMGYAVFVCYGWENARDCIIKYLGSIKQ